MRYPVMLFPEGDPSKAYAIATEPGEEAALRKAGYRTLREMKAANEDCVKVGDVLTAPDGVQFRVVAEYAVSTEIPAAPRKRGRPRKE